VVIATLDIHFFAYEVVTYAQLINLLKSSNAVRDQIQLKMVSA